MIKVFSQKDKHWINKVIPGSRTTLGKSGCVICSLASLISWYGSDETPLTLSDKLKFYKDTGLVIWQSLEAVYPIKWVERVHCEKVSAPMDRIDKLLAEGNPVIVKINKWHGHWVTLFRKVGNRYLMTDSLYGDIEFLDKRYGNPKVAIIGLAIYKKEKENIKLKIGGILENITGLMLQFNQQIAQVKDLIK